MYVRVHFLILVVLAILSFPGMIYMTTKYSPSYHDGYRAGFKSGYEHCIEETNKIEQSK
jgi:hypothetical protein